MCGVPGPCRSIRWLPKTDFPCRPAKINQWLPSIRTIGTFSFRRCVEYERRHYFHEFGSMRDTAGSSVLETVCSRPLPSTCETSRKSKKNTVPRGARTLGGKGESSSLISRPLADMFIEDAGAKRVKLSRYPPHRCMCRAQCQCGSAVNTVPRPPKLRARENRRSVPAGAPKCQWCGRLNQCGCAFQRTASSGESTFVRHDQTNAPGGLVLR